MWFLAKNFPEKASATAVDGNIFNVTGINKIYFLNI